MGIGAGGKIKQHIEEDDNDAGIWDTANSKFLNIQIINSIDFHNITTLPPPETPIDVKTYADAGLPFYDLYREKESEISGAFHAIKGVAQIEMESARTALSDTLMDGTGEQDTHNEGREQCPELSIEVPIVMLDVDDTATPFKSVNALVDDDEWQSDTESEEGGPYMAGA